MKCLGHGSASRHKALQLYHILQIPIKPPFRLEIEHQLLPQKHSPEQLDRHNILPQHTIMKGLLRHPSLIHDLPSQRHKLQSAQHIASLIERAPLPIKRASNFALGIGPFETYFVHEEVDAFLRRHFAEVKVDGEDDAGCAVHAPEKHADAFSSRILKVGVVEEKHFPWIRLAFV
jgi:hypothetical protein